MTDNDRTIVEQIQAYAEAITADTYTPGDHMEGQRMIAETILDMINEFTP